MEMDWNDQYDALAGLGADICLRKDARGLWYLALRGVEIGGDGFLSSVGVHASTPESAVEKTWAQVTTANGGYVVLNAMSEGRRHVRWNGFMWTDLPVPALH